MKATLSQYIETLPKGVETVVAISDRTHYIFNPQDELAIGWAELFMVTEVVSKSFSSVVIQIEYIDEE